MQIRFAKNAIVAGRQPGRDCPVFDLKQSNQPIPIKLQIASNGSNLLRLGFFSLCSFYTVNEVHKFQYSRPVRKGENDPDNEFAVLSSYIYIYLFIYFLSRYLFFLFNLLFDALKIRFLMILIKLCLPGLKIFLLKNLLFEYGC